MVLLPVHKQNQLAELVNVVEVRPKAQVSRAAKQPILLDTKPLVACSLPLCNEDRRAVEQSYHQTGDAVRVRQLYKFPNNCRTKR